ncbi:MAG: hypothetical protein ABR956_16055 [Terracidiphilus sp.]|jgi:hypothetical protein
MHEIGTVREAKDYLAGRIAAEAVREQIPLSEIERKMLYFSETDWTLPGMLEINAEFERNYDTSEYERKIAELIRHIKARHADDEKEKRIWDRAVEKLSEGDNYLSIMLNPSFAPVDETVRPPHDVLKLWLTALGIVCGTFGFLGLLNWAFGPRLWALQDWLSDHHAGRLPCLLFIVTIALCWPARAKISAVIDRLFNRKSTRSHTG